MVCVSTTVKQTHNKFLWFTEHVFCFWGGVGGKMFLNDALYRSDIIPTNKKGRSDYVAEGWHTFCIVLAYLF
jgi:hypothetical protein